MDFRYCAMGNQYDPRYLEGIECFNRGAFFDAHEAWEALWIDTEGASRRFYQGLIQVAVCLYHFGNGNLRGARKLYHSSSNYLQAYGPQQAGLDLDRFLQEFQHCCAELLSCSETSSNVNVKLDPQRVPHIELAATDQEDK
ncbi:MAG: DUF309 domain-containing protein [Pirellulaceae bacterium]